MIFVIKNQHLYIFLEILKRQSEIHLSLDYAHMRGYLIMFSEVSLALDSLIEEHYKDDEQQEVEDAENGQAAVIRVSFSS